MAPVADRIALDMIFSEDFTVFPSYHSTSALSTIIGAGAAAPSKAYVPKDLVLL
jgi:hypothetical protein